MYPILVGLAGLIRLSEESLVQLYDFEQLRRYFWEICMML